METSRPKDLSWPLTIALMLALPLLYCITRYPKFIDLAFVNPGAFLGYWLASLLLAVAGSLVGWGAWHLLKKRRGFRLLLVSGCTVVVVLFVATDRQLAATKKERDQAELVNALSLENMRLGFRIAALEKHNAEAIEPSIRNLNKETGILQKLLEVQEKSLDSTDGMVGVLNIEVAAIQKTLHK